MRELEHLPPELLSAAAAGEDVGELSDRADAREHLQGCPECQAGVARSGRVDAVLRAAPVPLPSELEWARMRQRARRPATSWGLLAAAALLALLIPASLAWFLPPCDGGCSGDVVTPPALESVVL